jgi:transcriptional regulator of acetoin/glycerol metabolism
MRSRSGCHPSTTRSHRALTGATSTAPSDVCTVCATEWHTTSHSSGTTLRGRVTDIATVSWLKGKQPKLSRKQEAHLVSLVHGGEYSTLEVAELFGIGRSTVYRAIERQRIAAKADLADASTRR